MRVGVVKVVVARFLALAGSRRRPRRYDPKLRACLHDAARRTGVRLTDGVCVPRAIGAGV